MITLEDDVKEKEIRESPGKASSEQGRRQSGYEVSVGGKLRRWSSRMKRDAVLRLLRGESFLAAGGQSLKAQNLRETDRRIAKLQRKVGELTMEVELLREKAKKLEVNAPNFPWRRSRK